MAPFLIPLVTAIPSIISAFKPNTGAKGLVGSKTANTAHAALAAKVAGIFMLPIPSWLQYTLLASVVVEWLVQLYLRVITKGAVV